MVHGALVARLWSILLLALQVLEACVESGAWRGSQSHANQDSMARNPAVARLQAEDASSVDSRGSSGFGGTKFWDALRQVGISFQLLT